ncbi:hypothetical protein [Streptomyces sp. CB01881]|nr:hypothetical protein [Streptomyces sp. CB01881]
MADRVAVMKDSHLVETGDVDELFARPAADYTRQLLAAAAAAAPVEART